MPSETIGDGWVYMATLFFDNDDVSNENNFGDEGYGDNKKITTIMMTQLFC